MISASMAALMTTTGTPRFSARARTWATSGSVSILVSCSSFTLHTKNMGLRVISPSSLHARRSSTDSKSTVLAGCPLSSAASSASQTP
jgi:hypothetical protein